MVQSSRLPARSNVILCPHALLPRDANLAGRSSREAPAVCSVRVPVCPARRWHASPCADAARRRPTQRLLQPLHKSRQTGPLSLLPSLKRAAEKQQQQQQKQKQQQCRHYAAGRSCHSSFSLRRCGARCCFVFHFMTKKLAAMCSTRVPRSIYFTTRSFSCCRQACTAAHTPPSKTSASSRVFACAASCPSPRVRLHAPLVLAINCTCDCTLRLCLRLTAIVPAITLLATLLSHIRFPPPAEQPVPELLNVCRPSSACNRCPHV